MSIKAKIIISRYKEDFLWIKEYTENYIIYNKGDIIEGDHRILNVENIGGNQRDIFKYIVDNYEDLPELMAFIQAFPFDHCKKEKFDKLIQNEYFTPIEDFDHIPESWFTPKIEGGYSEFNNSWYITSHNQTYNQTCKYSSFDDFMNQTFQNYSHVDFIRFSPGSQYIIEKKQALYYPKYFWEFLMNNLNTGIRPTEGHIIERAMILILKCNLELRNK